MLNESTMQEEIGTEGYFCSSRQTRRRKKWTKQLEIKRVKKKAEMSFKKGAKLEGKKVRESISSSPPPPPPLMEC